MEKVADISLDAPDLKLIRLKGRSKKGSGPRVLKVKFSKTKTAQAVMTKWLRIPIAERKQRSPAALDYDLTPLQRQERVEKRAERDAKQKELDDQGITDHIWTVTRENVLRKIKI